MNEHKTYVFDVCEDNPQKICSGDCKGCGEPVLFTDVRGRTCEVVGLDVVERVKEYQQKHGCNYETALLQVSKTKENEHGL